MRRLEPQLSDAVGVYTLEDEGAETTGRKRQRLIEETDAEFVAHVDDDDLVAPTYVGDILGAIKQGADVVGFKVRCYEDGGLSGFAVHSLANDRWSEQRLENGMVHYTRTPNHLNPIRRNIALQVGFPSETVGEDADYARRLYAGFGKTMKEVFLDKCLYDYFQRTRMDEPIVQKYDDAGRLTKAGMEEAIRAGGSVLFNGQLCTKLEQLAG